MLTSQAPQPPRRPGRPPRPDAHATRALLLDTATAQFAQHGVAATTIARIAQAAGVTPAMVHYYFRNRDALLDTLVAERLVPLIEYVWSPPGKARSPRDMVRAIVARLMECAAQRPWLPPLWMREVVNEGGELRERVLSHLPTDRLRAFAQELAQAQARGQVHAGIDPRLVFLSILGTTLLPLATAGVWRRVWDQEQALDTAAISAHACALIEHGLFPSTRRRP
ncbi:TetR/AcrR family transcriptional regulator [Bordetella genomosp. 12]|uniref:TetR family transcriptional regulator n=1 Tax=Bordetella genomosp. 12 TaxID=463035 RepID=A0A261VN88_9BORD|nr:TetR family transcriptional regulator [Bordetella genomosp. 12]OZI75030.1 TetR family transcriptional regulator [Bordetella genomosp. 12]